MGEKEQWCLFAAGDQEAAGALFTLKCTHKLISERSEELRFFSPKTLSVLLLKFEGIGGAFGQDPRELRQREVQNVYQ